MGIKKLMVEDKKIVLIAVSAGIAFAVSGAYRLGCKHGFRGNVQMMIELARKAKELGEVIPFTWRDNVTDEKAYLYILPEITDKFVDMAHVTTV